MRNLLFALVFILTTSLTATDSAKYISYMVVVSIDNISSVHNTPDISHANNIIRNYFPSFVNVEDYFGDGNYFEIRNYKYYIYIEKKMAVRKLNGKIKYRKLK